MDLQCFHSRSRLKIRRAPSCKISSSQTSSSFHGCACRQLMKKKGCKQPLIFHTFDPEIILTEPAEFMSLVQRLTGSAQTRRLVRTSMRKSKEMQSSMGTADVAQHVMHESRKDPLKEGSTIILAPACLSKPNVCTNDVHPCPNPNDRIINQAPLSSYANNNNNPPLSPASSNSHPLAAPLSSDTNQLMKNHPSSSLSSNSAISEENPFSEENPLENPFPSTSGAIINMSKESSQLLPFSPHNPKTPFSSSCLHEKTLQPSVPLLTPKPNKCKPLIIDSNQISLQSPMSILPLPAKASDELSPLWSPVSPHSSLTTTSSLEGDHTDNLSTEGGASPYRDALSACLEEEGSTLINGAEEDGSTHFFVFSGDSYYGSSYEAAAAQDGEEFQYSNVLDSFSQFNMPLGTHSEALSFFKDNIVEEEEALYS